MGEGVLPYAPTFRAHTQVRPYGNWATTGGCAPTSDEEPLTLPSPSRGEQLSFLSSALSHFRAPRGPMFQHRIQNDQQFAHAGRQRDLLRLPGSAQALIEHAEDGIEASRHDCAHIEHGADLRPAAP